MKQVCFPFLALLFVFFTMNKADAFTFQPCPNIPSAITEPPTHEQITALAFGLEEYEYRKLDPEVVRGLIFNDDPHGWTFNYPAGLDYNCGLGVLSKYFSLSGEINKAALPTRSLSFRSHFGDLSFLHSMASHHGQAIVDVQRELLSWAQLVMLVWQDPQTVEQPLSLSSRLPILAKRFSSENTDWSLCEFRGSGIGDDRTYKKYCEDIRSLRLSKVTPRILICETTLREESCRPNERFLGSLLHLIQDSYSLSHTERDNEKRLIHAFFYGDQSFKAHAVSDRCIDNSSDARPDKLAFLTQVAMKTVSPCKYEAYRSSESVVAIYKSRTADKLTQLMRTGPFSINDQKRLENENIKLNALIKNIQLQLDGLLNAYIDFKKQMPPECKVIKRDGIPVLQLREAVLFSPGAAEIGPKGQVILKAVMAGLEKSSMTISGRILVSGHTDPRPVKGGNWLLSARRAAAVVGYLISSAEKGSVLSRRFIAAGYADTLPTGNGNNEDRRVEIGIQPDMTKLLNAIEGSSELASPFRGRKDVVQPKP